MWNCVLTYIIRCWAHFALQKQKLALLQNCNANIVFVVKKCYKRKMRNRKSNATFCAYFMRKFSDATASFS